MLTSRIKQVFFVTSCVAYAGSYGHNLAMMHWMGDLGAIGGIGHCGGDELPLRTVALEDMLLGLAMFMLVPFLIILLGGKKATVSIFLGALIGVTLAISSWDTVLTQELADCRWSKSFAGEAVGFVTCFSHAALILICCAEVVIQTSIACYFPTLPTVPGGKPEAKTSVSGHAMTTSSERDE
jgi:hypothetical protein